MAARRVQGNGKLNAGVYSRPGGRHQAHISIPADVRFAFGRDKVVLSLGTRDPDEANREHAKLRSQYEAAFDAVRRGSNSPEFARFARKLYADQLEHDVRYQDWLDAKHLKMSNPTLEGPYIRALEAEDPDQLAAVAGWAADWFYATQTSDGDPDKLPAELRQSPAYRSVLADCAAILRDAARTGSQRVNGRTETPPRHRLLKRNEEESPDGNRAVADEGRLRLSEYHEKVYLPAKAASLTSGTVEEKKRDIALFNGLMGDPPLYLVQKAHLTGFQAKLRKYPDGRSIVGDLEDLSPTELYDKILAGQLDLPKAAAGTINKRVRNVKAVLNHAFGQGHTRISAAHGVANITPDAENGVTERRAFTRAEIDRIFKLPIYAGCRGASLQRQFKPGKVLLRDDRFWLPVLLFLTGARSEEIAGLEVRDVVIDPDGDASRFIIRPNTIRPRLKNDSSARVVPIHPWAFAMGFRQFYEDRVKTGEVALLPVASSVDGAAGGVTEETVAKAAPARQFNRTVLKHAGLTVPVPGGRDPCCRRISRRRSRLQRTFPFLSPHRTDLWQR